MLYFSLIALTQLACGVNNVDIHYNIWILRAVNRMTWNSYKSFLLLHF